MLGANKLLHVDEGGLAQSMAGHLIIILQSPCIVACSLLLLDVSIFSESSSAGTDY